MELDTKENRPLTASPTIKKKMREVEIEIKEKDYDNKLNSCCSGTTDKRLLEVGFKMSIVSIVLVFSLAMIGINSVNGDSCNHFNPMYMSLVTLIIGVFVPQPKLKKIENK